MIKKISLKVLVISFLFLTTFNSISFSYGQNNIGALKVDSIFEITEFSEQIGYNNSINSINVDLPSAMWNITEIEMNFTDIRLGKEIKTIEEEGNLIKSISWRDNYAFGVELNITEITTLFGVYIYIYYEPRNVTMPIYVQIQGYDILNNIPYNNILGSTEINASKIPSWQYQEFDEAILLVPGKYYLVINGTSLNTMYDKTIYNWFSNQSSSLNPLLHSAAYNGSEWSEENVGAPFLHKLVQRVDRSFDPEELNLTLDIDGSLYPVGLNGSISIHKLISPDTTNFNIPILNNQSIELLFNLSFHIKLQNSLLSIGNVLIREQSNFWSLEPNFESCYCNYSIKFIYPNDWYNLTIFRDLGVGWENISSLVDIDSVNNYIFISTENILEDASWRITANSQNTQPALNLPITQFKAGQNIQFSVNAPIYPGKLVFRLFNPIGFLAQPDEIYDIDLIQSENLLLYYPLSDNPHEGIYKTFVFWYNGTAAGVITQEFEVIVPFLLDPIVIIGLFLLTSTLGIASYKVIKMNKRRITTNKRKIIEKFRDLRNLEYFIIIHKESAINLYEQIFASKIIDGLLVSGFLDAIRSFGIELTGADKNSQTIKLEYQNSKILMSEYKSFRTILIMKENPSQNFLESINQLSYDIENKYGKQIENFIGDTKPFEGIKDIIELHLQTSFIYPLEITNNNIRFSQDETSLIERARDLMKQKNTDYFMLMNLIDIKKGFHAKEAETILRLFNKKIFQPKGHMNSSKLLN